MGKPHVSSQYLREAARRREKEKLAEPPVSWTWKERLAAGTLILIILVGGLGPYTAYSIYGYKKATKRRIDRLKTKYELNDTQVRQLRNLEREYRGSGNPFSFRRSPSATEREHYRKRLNELIHRPNSGEHTESESN